MKKLSLYALALLFVSSLSLQAADLTLQELSKYNGKDKPQIYVAVDGVIYDVTNHPAWNGKYGEKGKHQGNYAGQDLTDRIDTVSPHGRKVLKDVPVVGKLKK